MSTEKKISAVIITFNEERNIGRCIDSLQGVVDEIVVVDSLSKDKTVAIAKEKGARVVDHAFEGYIEQKNYAITCAQHEYVLSLDADEALSKELTRSIFEVKEELKFSVYSFNRLTNYCGKWISHCGWYPDVKVRLFDKSIGSWGGKNPHDTFIARAGATSLHLSGDLLHYSYYTREEHAKQIEHFSTIGAQAYYDKGKRSSTFKIVLSPTFIFIRNYIFRLGFLDGYFGWLVCIGSAKSTYLKYAKLKRIQAGKIF